MANSTNIPFGYRLPFNPKPSTRLHIDLNSCFATIEQQANPYLRNRAMAVGAYDSPGGAIIAPSIEAKKKGIVVGMRVRDGKLIDPKLVVLTPDPDKYRTAHLRIKKLLLDYTDEVEPKSIDEFVLNLEGYPCFRKGVLNVATEIKKRIRDEIGDWLRVNIGIAPNRFLAKQAAGLHKPDGLDEINRENYEKIFSFLQLTDLTGIKKRFAARLHGFGIYSVMDFYQADPFRVKNAFRSVIGFDWYLRLRGWEVDDITFPRRSFGNSFALGMNLSTPQQLAPILSKLVDKTAWRMRVQGYKAKGIHLALSFKSGNHWHRGVTTSKLLYNTADIYRDMFRLLTHCPYREPVQIMAETVFNLVKEEGNQLELFDNINQKVDIARAMDQVKNKYGQFMLIPGTMLGTEDIMPDRVSFGGVKELLDSITDEDLMDIDNFRDDVYPDLEI